MGSNAAVRYFAVWLYHFPFPDNGEMLNELALLRVNLVFMSVQQPDLTNNKNLLVDFIGRAHAAGIEVHAMTLEDASFAETGQHAAGCAIVAAFLDFVKANPGSAFDGIHIDTEPQNLFDSQDDAFNKSLMEQYTQLVEDVARLISAAGLPPNAHGTPFQFSAATGWWYNRQALSGVYPSVSATLLSSFLSFLVPMVYNGIPADAGDISSRIDDTVMAAPTLVGISACNYPSRNDLDQARAGLDAYFANFSNYLGVSVYKYDTFSQLRRSGG